MALRRRGDDGPPNPQNLQARPECDDVAVPMCRYAYTLALSLSATVYVLAAIRSITSCVRDMVLIMWWFSKHMHLHLCRYMFIMLCASPPPLVRSPRSSLLD